MTSPKEGNISQLKTCFECPCKELTEAVQSIRRLEKELVANLDRLAIEGSADRRRITVLEGTIEKLKSNLAQATAVKTSGSWGISQKRAEVIYSRLLTSKNGNGRAPFLTTGDVKKILGVPNYSQAKSAIEECIKIHLDTRIVARGKKKIGIELLENFRVPLGQIDPSGRKKLW